MSDITISAGIDSSELKKGRVEIRSALESLRKVAADATNRGTDKLNQSLSKLSSITIANSQQISKLNKNLGNVGTRATRVSQSVNKATGEMNSLQRGLLALQKTVRTIDGPLGGVAARIDTIGSVAKTGEGSLIRFVAAIGSFGIVTTALFKTGSAFQNLSNKLKLVTDSTAELVAVRKELFDISLATRISAEATFDVYSKLGRATQDLGISQTRLLKVTETINKTVALSNTTSQSAAAALFQFSQGLAANALRGQELNSVIEQTPELARAIASGLGVSFGELRNLAKEGELTAEVIIEALEKGAKDVDAAYADLEISLSSSLGKIKDSAVEVFGGLDASQGSVKALATSISFLADNLQTLVTVATLAIQAFAGLFIVNKLNTLFVAHSATLRAVKAGYITSTDAVGVFSNIATTKLRLSVGAVTAQLGVMKTALLSSTGSLAGLSATAKASAIALGTLNLAARTASIGIGLLGKAISLVGGPLGLLVIAYTAYQAVMERQKVLDEEAAKTLAKRVDKLKEEKRALDLSKAGQEERLEGLRKEINLTLEATMASLQLSRMKRIALINSGTLNRALLKEQRKLLQQDERNLGNVYLQIQANKKLKNEKFDIAKVIEDTLTLEEKYNRSIQEIVKAEQGLLTLQKLGREETEDGVSVSKALVALGRKRLEIEMDYEKATKGVADEQKSNLDDRKKLNQELEQLVKRNSDFEEKRIFALEEVAELETKILDLKKQGVVETENGVALDDALVAVSRERLKIEEDYRKYIEDNFSDTGEITKIFKDFYSGLESGTKSFFKTFISEGKITFDSFQDLFTDMLASLATQAAKTKILIPIASAVGSGLGLSQSGINGALGLPSGGTGGVGLPSINPFSGFGFNGGAASFVDNLLAGTSGTTGVLAPTTLGTAAGGAFSAGAGIGGFGGNLLANALFGDRGVGASVGGTLGGLGGGAAAALLGATGPIGLAIGGLLGAFGGNLLGGLFGGKPSSREQNATLDLTSGNITARRGLEGDKFSQENFDAVTSLAELTSALTNVLGGLDEELTVFASDRVGLGFQYTGDERINGFNTAGEFIEGFVNDLTTRLEDIPESLETALQNIDFSGNTEQALSDLAFAVAFDKINFETAPTITALEQAMQSLATSMQEASDKAKELGLDVAVIERAGSEAAIALTESFDKNIQDQKLKLEDPVAASLQDLNTRFSTLRRDAIAANGDLIAVEELYALERQKILEQSNEAINAGFTSTFSSIVDSIRQFRDDLEIDTTVGGTNRLGRLQITEARFANLSSRISSGDTTALEEVEKISQEYLNASVDYFGQTSDHLANLTDVRSLLDAAESLAQNSLSLDEQTFNEAVKQTELLQKLVEEGNLTSSIFSQLGTVSTGQILRAGENLAGLSGKFDNILKIPLETARKLKVAVSGGEFDFTQGRTFADFIKAGNQDLVDKFLTAAAAIGGQNLDVQKTKFFASGTGSSLSARGLAIVGERGPELVNFGLPAQVISNKDSMTIAGNSGMSEEQIRAMRDQSAKQTVAILDAVDRLIEIVSDLPSDIGRAVQSQQA